MPARKLPPNDILIAMYESGLGSGDIAKALNLSVNTVLSGLKTLAEAGLLVMRTQSEAIKASFANGRKPTKPWLGEKAATGDGREAY
jgi:hypothetical protein